MKTASTRDMILDAAQRIAVEHGSGRITLDKVARESGFSKGGLLYHFATKEALLQAMLERLIARTRTVRETHEQTLSGQPWSVLRAMLAARMDPDVLDPRVTMAILTSAAEQPALLDPLRQYIQQTRKRILEEERESPTAWLLWAAADGLLFQELLDISPVPSDQRSQVYQQLQRLAKDLLK